MDVDIGMKAGSGDNSRSDLRTKSLTVAKFLRNNTIGINDTADVEANLSRQDLYDKTDGTSWTATRSLRLLRPLRAALNALQYENDNALSSARSQENGRRLFCRKEELWESENTLAQDPESAADVEDPDFVPTEPSRRAQKTYSLRKRALDFNDRARQPYTEYQSLTAAISVVDKAMDEVYKSHFDSNSSETTEEYHIGRGSKEKQSRASKFQLTFLRGRYGRLYTSFERLIRSTSSGPLDSPTEENCYLDSSLVSQVTQSNRGDICVTRSFKKRRGGAKSLFQTCLAKVPEFIENEQDLVDQKDDRERYDVSEEIYSQLQGLSTNPQGDWRPLRIIVRAHGMRWLCDAITSGLLSPEAIQMHIDACGSNNFTEGAKQIISAWGKALNSGQFTCVIPFTQIQKIRAASAIHGCEYIFWKWLSSAVTRTSVQQMDVLADMKSLWTSSVYCLTSLDHYKRESAIELIEKLISCAIMDRRVDSSDAVHRLRLAKYSIDPKLIGARDYECATDESLTRIEIAPILSAILTYLSTTATFDRPHSGFSYLVLKRLVAFTEISLTVTDFSTCNDFQKTVALLPWLSLHVLQAFLDDESLFSSHQDRKFMAVAATKLDEGAAFCLSRHALKMARAAYKYGERSSCTLKTYVQTASQRLLQLGNEKKIPLLSNVAVKIAFEFAEYDPKKSNTSFALKLEEEAMLQIDEDDGRADEAKSSDLAPDRWRWEESISEWVRLTPMRRSGGVKVVVPARQLLQDGRDETSKCQVLKESPLRCHETTFADTETTIDSEYDEFSGTPESTPPSNEKIFQFTESQKQPISPAPENVVMVVLPPVPNSMKKFLDHCGPASSPFRVHRRPKLFSRSLRGWAQNRENEKVEAAMSSPLAEKADRRQSTDSRNLRKRQRTGEPSHDTKSYKRTPEAWGSEDELAL